MAKRRDTLIFFSERYPNEYIGGVYEEREIREFEKYFKRIIVISTSKNDALEPSFYIPNNLIFKSFNSDLSFIEKLWSIRLILSSDFLKEYNYIKNILKLKLNFKIIVIALIEMQKARKLKRSVINLLKNYAIDTSETIIYSFWNDFRAYAAVILKRALKESKAISRSHGGDVYFERHPFNYLPFKTILYNELNGIYPISKNSEIYLKNKLQVDDDKIKSYHLGVSNLNTYEIPQFHETLKIVSCSHIVKIKRVELIAQGLSNLKEIPYHWFHIGDDYMGGKVMGICENHLTNYNQKYSLLGSLDNKEIMEFYKSNNIDLFINLSESEGVPISIMEAMSFGIPVIATNVGSTSEIVIDGITGFLLSPNPTLQEIKEVITKFHLLNIEDKKRMHDNAYSYWRNEFNADENYPKFVKMVIDL